MNGFIRIIPLLTGSSLLVSCSNLNYIHDPQTGLISKDQIDPFLKSVRCEMKTFYTANDANQKRYQAELKKSDNKVAEAKKDEKEGNQAAAHAALAEAADLKADAVKQYPHFLLAPDLFGGVYLDLKVIDTFGFPNAGASSSTLDLKTVLDATHTRTLLFGPTLNNQNTYEEIDNYLIEQTPGLATDADPFNCYARLAGDLNAVAAGDYPEAEQFTRIRVNGLKPLAAWLQDRSAQQWKTFHASTDQAETDRLIPVQSTYNFTVQITAGLDVKYSIVAPVWNPAQIDFGASSIQSSALTISLNGIDASLAAGAKTGIAVNSPTSHGITQAGGPRFVSAHDLRAVSEKLNLGPDQKSLVDKFFKPDTIEGASHQLNLNPEQNKKLRQLLPESKAPVVPAAPGKSGSRGYLLYPLPLTNPGQ